MNGKEALKEIWEIIKEETKKFFCAVVNHLERIFCGRNKNKSRKKRKKDI